MHESIAGPMTMIAIAWTALVVLMWRQTTRISGQSVGLPLAFALATSFAYCGAFVYAVPDYTPYRSDGDAYLLTYIPNPEVILRGAMASLLGFASFAAGCFLGGPAPIAFARRPINGLASQDRDRKLMLWLGGIGALSFVMNAVNPEVPLAQAAISVGQGLAVVVVCMSAALAQRRAVGYAGWIVVGLVIPVLYLVVWGFTSYGFSALTLMAAFWLAQMASRRIGWIRLSLGATFLAYATLSLFVTWMTFREEIRDVVREATISERVDSIVTAFGQTELLRFDNFASLDLINVRLNQAAFVGMVIDHHEAHPELSEQGRTIFLAPLALVPRFLWPEKPTLGGSEFLAKHTGREFSDYTTFGVGPVIDFYANFGHLGIVVGLFLMGFFLRRIDTSTAKAFADGRLLDTARWFMVGMAFVAPLTDFFFIVNGAAISWIMLTGIKMALSPPLTSEQRLT